MVFFAIACKDKCYFEAVTDNIMDFTSYNVTYAAAFLDPHLLKNAEIW